MSFPRDTYPYTNFHELNLGYFIVHFREIFSQWADLYDQMTDWKDATDEELATWKAGVEADLDQREEALRAELETWKTQTGQDIAGWEDATLVALTAWQTATQAVFEAIRVEAAGSASAAAASATQAATARTAAETAQAAAEAAAASIASSAAQIATNTEDISELKTQFEEVVETLEDNGTIVHKYVLHKVIENATVNSSGVMTSGPAGTNAYIYQIDAGTEIIVTGGNVHAFFATDPVKQTTLEEGTVTIDGTRHVGPLNGTKITMPVGANYLSISNTAEPTIESTEITTDEKVNTLETDMQTGFEGVNNSIDELQERLIDNGTLTRLFHSINIYDKSTIAESGIIDSGPSDSNVNVYVFGINEGTTISVTGGNIYGLYATNPVKHTISEEGTATVDGTRHVGGLSNTPITMPTGADYIAIAATSEPTVIIPTETTAIKTAKLEVDMADMKAVVGSPLSFSESGFINTSGVFVSNASYKCTDYIPVTANGSYLPISYRVKGNNSTCIAFYDAEHAMIKAIPISDSSSLVEFTGTLDYVSCSVYVRLCSYYHSGSTYYTDYYAKYASMKNTVTGIIPYPTDYQGTEICVFNKILCIGDSLTAGTFNYRVDSSTSNYIEDAKYSYPTYLKKITGCDTTNLGNGGKTSLEWYQLHQNDDLSGYDCAIIQLGVNDVGRYGTWGQDSIDGFTGIINKLKTENKNIKIFVANIIPARSYHSDSYINMSNAISTFIEGLNDPQVMLLDIQQYGHTYDSAAYNCGHLSALGYWRLAQDYKSYISWHIFMNKTDFKEVQFIGTDYYYDPIT